MPLQPRNPRTDFRSGGFVLVSVLFMSVVIAALLWAMFELTTREIRSSKSTADITSGFFAAEAGLNIRGEEIRREFEGYRRPEGSSPLGGDCEASPGSGDFQCKTYELNDRAVETYVEEDPRNNDPDDDQRLITIPPGELFAGLSAMQYRYSVFSEATPPNDDRPEAILEMVFRTRLVPMFQFAAFFDKDLEILPGADMRLDGRIHANGDLYVNASPGEELSIHGQVTTAVRSDGSGGGVHRGRKDRDECAGTIGLPDGDSSPTVVPCQGSSHLPLPDETFADFNGMVQTRLDLLQVPEPELFSIGDTYWDEADVRIALDLRNGEQAARPVVLDEEISSTGKPVVDESLTTRLNVCLAHDANRVYSEGVGTERLQAYSALFGDPGVRAVEYSSTLTHAREGGVRQKMLEVDARGLLDCLHQNRFGFFAGQQSEYQTIGTDRNGGLLWYLTVLGPDASSDRSGYGVRVRNGARLASTASGAPEIEGLTIVSDQAAFIMGDYNVGGSGGSAWRPSAFIADTINILSNDWDDDAKADLPLALRGAAPTTVNAAFLAGTDVTGGADGEDGQRGAYSGGLENYPRFHEDWNGTVFTYRGSFVSLGEPQHANGQWQLAPVYSPPGRDWNYDVRFNQAQNLPPLSPRFVYLVQERFVRDFQR